MKTLIATLLFTLVTASAHADANMDRQSYCGNYGTMFSTIAAWRDRGTSQETTLKMIVSVKGISPQAKKDAVQAVYSDKNLQSVRGPALAQQVQTSCLAAKTE